MKSYSIMLFDSFLKKSFICIVILFTILSPTANFILKEYSYAKEILQFFILIIMFSFLYSSKITKYGLVVIVFSIFVGIITLSPIIVFKVVIFLFFLTLLIDKYHNTIRKTIIIVFLVNSFFVFAQLVGISDWFYLFQDYSNEAEPTVGEFNIGASVDFVFAYLPQLRPSGIFPAPTYVSYFCILFWYTVLIDYFNLNRFISFLFGFTLMLLGSTLGAFLLLLSFFLLNSHNGILYFLIGGLSGLSFYIYSFPSTFTKNFNIEEFSESFLVRIINSGENEESILISNPIVFFLLLIIVLIFILSFSKLRSKAFLLNIAVVVFLPLMIHESISSIQYWFTVCFLINKILSDKNIYLISDIIK